MNINKHVFEANPVRLDISRSKFDLSHNWKGTFDTGKMIPIYAAEVLPGSTYKLGSSCVIRSTTPVAPVMDNAFADVFYFFVPNKLTLSRQSMSPAVDDASHSWEAFIGAQDNLLNMPLPGDVELPCLSFGKINNDANVTEVDFERGSLADYLGLPDFSGSFASGSWARRINCLVPLAYYSIFNHYFRDPSTMNPVTYSILNGSEFGGTHPRVNFYGGPRSWAGHGAIGLASDIMPVSRFHGYFGSALPWPQRNSTQVELPLGDSAPVIPSGSTLAYGDTLHLGSNISGGGASSYSGGLVPDDLSVATFTWQNTGSYGRVNGTNLVADLSQATAASVNALRFAVQAQRWYEALARGGNRIGEMTVSMFGVTPSDASSGRPEYLGGKRIMINVQQVANTAGTNISTQTQQSIGSTGAYSLTTDDDFYFTKSFDTWGVIIGIVAVRTAETFHQGLARKYTRFDRFDFYWPQFANLGEQAIKNKEIFMDGSSDDELPFGYQEAWAEYRFDPDVVTGLTRPGDNQAYWTYANNFTSRPNLASYLNAEGQKDNVDRTLQVPSSTAGFQWMADFHFDVTAVLPMPTYSIPGLVDHH